MNKLTQQEAQLVLQESYRLQVQYADSKSRLGQSLHWVSSLELGVNCPEHIKSKLFALLEETQGQPIDFYYYTDDNKVLEVFYKHFVEAE